MLYHLTGAFFENVVLKEPKQPDYILCKDYRNHSAKTYDEHGLPERLDHPDYYFFDLKMTQVFATTEKRFKWTYGQEYSPEEEERLARLDIQYQRFDGTQEWNSEEYINEVEKGMSSLFKEIEDIETQREPLLPDKHESYRYYLEERHRMSFVQFYHVKGNYLDQEVKEILVGQDIVRTIKETDSTYLTTQIVLFWTSFFVLFYSQFAMPKQFDYDLSSYIADATNGTYSKCRNPKFQRHLNEAPGLLVMIIGHLLIIVTLYFSPHDFCGINVRLPFKNSFRTLQR